MLKASEGQLYNLACHLQNESFDEFWVFVYEVLTFDDLKEKRWKDMKNAELVLSLRVLGIIYYRVKYWQDYMDSRKEREK